MSRVSGRQLVQADSQRLGVSGDSDAFASPPGGPVQLHVPAADVQRPRAGRVGSAARGVSTLLPAPAFLGILGEGGDRALQQRRVRGILGEALEQTQVGLDRAAHGGRQPAP